MICKLKPYKPRLFGWRRAFVYWPRIICDDDNTRHFVWWEWAWVKGYWDNEMPRKWAVNPPESEST